MPGFGIVHHVGRKSGQSYAVPVNVFRQGDAWIIALTYGSESDWVKNVLAAGGCTLKTRGATVYLVEPVIEIDRRKAWAPLPVRLILRAIRVDMVMRLRAG
jgi:deazaflavin-dependent oxidoreductase (nitroreductase family)